MPYTTIPQRRYAARRMAQREDDYFADDRSMESLDLRTSNIIRAGDTSPRRQGSDGSDETLYGSDTEPMGAPYGLPRGQDYPRRPADAHFGRGGQPRRRAAYRRESDPNEMRWNRGGDGETPYGRGGRASTDDDGDEYDNDEEEVDNQHQHSYFHDVISRFMGDSNRLTMRRSDSRDSTGEPWPMTREKAREDDSDGGYALSRTHSIPRTMSDMSCNSDRSLAESEGMDPYDLGTDDDDDEVRSKGKGKKRVFASTAEEAEMIANMTYMQRRKYMSRVRIEFNTTGK